MVSWRLDGRGLPGPEREVVMVMCLMGILLVISGQEGRVITPSPDQYGDNTININHQQEDKVDIFTEFDAKDLLMK